MILSAILLWTAIMLPPVTGITCYSNMCPFGEFEEVCQVVCQGSHHFCATFYELSLSGLKATLFGCLDDANGETVSTECVISQLRGGGFVCLCNTSLCNHINVPTSNTSTPSTSTPTSSATVHPETPTGLHPTITTPRIENFQEVTTVNDSSKNFVAFSFTLVTGDFNDSAVNSAIFQLQSNSSRGFITLTLTEGHRLKQTNHTPEGAVTYHFTVNATGLGVGPLQLTLSVKLCLRYDNENCNRYPHPRCICSVEQQYEAESETIRIGTKRGDFDVVNFRDITSDSDNKSAIFEFEFDPIIHLDTSFGFELHLKWNQTGGPNSGVIEAANCSRYYRRTSARLERVGHTGTYRLYAPLHLFGEGRLLVNLKINISCINNPYWYSRNRCGCVDWQIRGTSDSLEISAKRGPLTIVDLRDITTQNDLNDEKAVFAFNIQPTLGLNIKFGYSVEIYWRQLRLEFGFSQGTHTYYFPPEGVGNCRGAGNTSLELVGADSYQLTLPTNLFHSGPLSISVSVSLVCIQLSSSRCPSCYLWRYTSNQRSSIDIPAKKGSLAPFEVNLELWPKEKCSDAAEAISTRTVSLSLVKAIRDNVADAAETSQLSVRSERYLCGHKDHLSFRGVLVKPFDFLAAKNRDVLSEWLTGGARHIVASKRQINIKEGFCGIALTTLEDPVCTKKAAGRG